MMKRAVLWVLVSMLSTLVMGCSPDREATVIFDSDFIEHPEEVEQLYAGVDQWHGAGLRYTYKFEDHESLSSKDPFWHANVIYVVRMRGRYCPYGGLEEKVWRTADPSPEATGKLGYTRHFFATDAKAICLNVDGLVGPYEGSLPSVFAHELGHVIGLADAPDEKLSVMSKVHVLEGVQPSDVAEAIAELN